MHYNEEEPTPIPYKIIGIVLIIFIGLLFIANNHMSNHPDVVLPEEYQAIEAGDTLIVDSYDRENNIIEVRFK